MCSSQSVSLARAGLWLLLNGLLTLLFSLFYVIRELTVAPRISRDSKTIIIFALIRIWAINAKKAQEGFVQH